MAGDFEIVAKLQAIDDGLRQAFIDASKSAQDLQHKIAGVNKQAAIMGGIIGTGAFAAFKFGKASFDAAARVSELDVAIKAVGKSSGVGAERIRAAALEIKKNGIETAAAQQMALEFAQGNLDLAQAAGVARVAQDLAVISQKNSTDQAMLLTRAIKTGNTMLLRGAGITTMASEGYSRYAKELKKSSNDLTATERQQAIINLIMEEGTKVFGVYDAAMKEPGKVIRSFPRLLNDMQVAFGSALVEGVGPVVKGFYDLTKEFSSAVSEGGALHPFIVELGKALQAMFAPMVSGVGHLAKLIKGMKDSKLSADGFGDGVQRLTPILMAASVGLTALTSKSILMLTPLRGLIGGFSPLMLAFGVFLIMTPKLRDSFMRIAEAGKPIITSLMSIAKSVLDASIAVVDGVASMMEAFAGPLGAIIGGIAKSFELFAFALTMIGPVLQPLILLIGFKLVAAMMSAKLATAQLAISNGVATASQTMLGQSYVMTGRLQMIYRLGLLETGSVTKALAGTTVAAMSGMKAAVMSFMASILPMLAVTAVITVALKLFSMFSNRNAEQKARTEELTGAIEEQVKTLGKNNSALGEYLQSVDKLSVSLTSGGEDGEKLTVALSAIGKSAEDAIPMILKFKENNEATAKSLLIAGGVSAEAADMLSRGMDGLSTKGFEANARSLNVVQLDVVRAVKELNYQADKTSIADMAEAYLSSTKALGKEQAATVASSRAIVDKRYETEKLVKGDQYYLDILDEVGKSIAATSTETKKDIIAKNNAERATKSLIQRLREMKSATDDGKFSAEQMAQELFGFEAIDAGKAARSFYALREGLTALVDGAKQAKGDTDALTKSSFLLSDEIAKNASSMQEAGRSAEDVAAMTTVMTQRFYDAAKAGGATDAQLKTILQTMGMLKGMRTMVVIDADITNFKKEMETVLAILKAMPRTDTMRGEYEQQYGDLKRLIESLGKEKTALDAANKSMTKIKDLTAEQAAADKKLQKQKDALKDSILALVNKALEAEEKKLEAITAKLDAMVDATKEAIMGGFNFGNALTAAKEKVKEGNEELQKLRDELKEYGDAARDAIYNTLSFADAMTLQSKATNDLEKANEDLLSAQTDMADANVKYADVQTEALKEITKAEEAYLKAHGRKERREALEKLTKVQTKAYEDVAEAAKKLIPVQEKLGKATDDVTKAQEKQFSFMDRLRKQAADANLFAQKIAELTAKGLSKDALGQIVAAGAETGLLVAKELLEGEATAIPETNELFKQLAEASKNAGADLAKNFNDIGTDVGFDFIKALKDQAEGARVFNERVNQLVTAGFGPEAIQEVLNAGVEAGTKIADALLTGGADKIKANVTEVNGMYATLKKSAEDLSKLLGDKFYQTGVDLAQRIVDGLKAKLKLLNDTLGDMTIKDLETTLDRLPKEISKITSMKPNGAEYALGTTMADVMATFPELEGNMLTPEMRQSMNDFFSGFDANSIGSFVGVHAEGGITKKAQIGIIGEAGPEMIMPLSQFNSQYGNAKNDGGTTITLNIEAGFGAGGKDIGDAIVNELIRYQRRNGKIPVKTL